MFPPHHSLPSFPFFSFLIFIMSAVRSLCFSSLPPPFLPWLLSVHYHLFPSPSFALIHGGSHGFDSLLLLPSLFTFSLHIAP
ncbi:uncharacterized protein EV422DRAFT_549192 [Fimicolochytrium jonesii]|uniref:uncharacterized protein n=1 Tax=Fimicolochytrium jonesii TaxID=1396493 RepID=UPI0022FE99DB|nr:uncharacterized protein EV422DRAFT_549192 [Fimicolochytrium jonesii]KAI8815550.1 hypothetical protein EV422DRAFT_549192 [Fimicolochytrium jonesii]